MKTPPFRHGFTLIELLVAIAIIAILTATGFGVMGKMRERSQAVQCLQNMRQIHQAVMLQVQENDGMFPANAGNPAHSSWARNWSGNLVMSGAFGPATTETWKIFRCPSAPSAWSGEGFYVHYGLNSYLAPGDNDRQFGRLIQVTSPSRTVMLTDSAFPNRTNPTSGFYLVVNAQRIHGRHSKKANVLFVDGHAESLSPTDDFGDDGPEIIFYR